MDTRAKGPSLRRWLDRLATVAASRPWLLLAVVVTPFAVLSLRALDTPVDLSFAGIMNRRDPEIARFFALSERYRLGGDLLLLLEGPDDELDEAAAALTRGLSRMAEVRTVASAVPTAWLTAQAPWLVDRETFDAWLRAVREPATLPAGDTSLEALVGDGAPGRSDALAGRRLLFLRLDDNPLDVALGSSLYFRVEAQAQAVVAPFGEVRLEISGLPAIAAQDQTRTLASIRRLSPISVLLVAVLFHRVDRSWRGLLAVLVPLGLAVTATLGLLGLLLGKITVMETFFGVTIMGLGVDFAVHLRLRLREEMARQSSFRDALAATLAGTGRGVVAGAVTTTGAFFIVALAPEPLAIHLGLSGGFGLLFCLVLMLGVLPAVWSLAHRRGHLDSSARGGGSTPPPRLLTSLAAVSVRHPWRCLVATGLLLAAAGAGVHRFRLETDLQRVFNRQVPALATTARVQELFGINTAPWILSADSLDEARALEAAITRESLFSSAESVADLLPIDGPDRHRELENLAPLLAVRRAQLEGLVTAQRIGAAEAATLERGLAILEAAAAAGPPTLDELPDGLRERLVAPDGTLFVYAYTAEPTFDGLEAARQRRVAQSLDPDAIALGTLLEAMMAIDRPWVWPVLAGIVVFVAIVLAVDMRHPRDALLALAPVVVGTGATFGVVCWAGVGFNVM
ncbi:MAG: MMPL family transporter, partial [Thermoanaerobaculia bacterium]|nr:MMPL family transporter [Thermoanaerobaculia bacterium]